MQSPLDLIMKKEGSKKWLRLFRQDGREKPNLGETRVKQNEHRTDWKQPAKTD